MADVRTARRGCTGHDRHRLGVPIIASATLMLGAAYIAAIGVLANELLVPLIIAICMWHIGALGLLTAVRLDGPIVRYRRWGLPRHLRLDEVFLVAMAPAKRPRMLVLRAPGMKPCLVPISRRSNDPAAVQRHLAGWLHCPGVQMSPQAIAYLHDETNAQPKVRSTATRGLALAMIMLGSVVLAGVAATSFDSTSKAFRHAASSASVQSSPTRTARVEALRFYSRSGHPTTLIGVTVLATGERAVVRTPTVSTARRGDVLNIRIDTGPPVTAELPGLPYYTRGVADRWLAFTILTAVAAVATAALGIVLSRRIMRAPSQTRARF